MDPAARWKREKHKVWSHTEKPPLSTPSFMRNQ